MQRPRDRTVPGVWRPVWLEQSERGGEREEVRAGRGGGQVVRTLWAEGRTWVFCSQRGGSPGGLWAEEGAGPDSGAHRRPFATTGAGDQGGGDCTCPGEQCWGWTRWRQRRGRSGWILERFVFGRASGLAKQWVQGGVERHQG